MSNRCAKLNLNPAGFCVFCVTSAQSGRFWLLVCVEYEVLNVNVCLTIFVALPGLFDGMLERMLSVQNGVLLNISIQAM